MTTIFSNLFSGVSGVRLALFCIIFSWFFPLAVSAELIDRVVAEVNEDVITLSELHEEGAAFIKRIITEAPLEERDRALQVAYNDILDGLIDKLLIYQEAVKQNIEVSDEEIEAAIEQIIVGNNITREDFLAELQRSGLSLETYKSNVASQIYQNKLITRDVRSKIVITEEMILDYYDDTYTRRVEEGGYYLLQIGIGWDEDADSSGQNQAPANREEARKRAERVHKLAVSGQDFKELARKFSDLPSASDGGDIGVFQEEDMASYMKEAVLNLEPGGVSAIIESPIGFQFFKLLSSREGGIVLQTPYDTVKEDIREQLYNEAMQEAFLNWIKDIKEQAYIKKLL